MLCLTRNVDQRVMLFIDGMEPIEIVVFKARNNQTMLGIKAPKEVRVHREEIAQLIEAKGEKP